MILVPCLITFLFFFLFFPSSSRIKNPVTSTSIFLEQSRRDAEKNDFNEDIEQLSGESTSSIQDPVFSIKDPGSSMKDPEAMSYKKLEIWQVARGLVIDIHKMTMEELPNFELYEEGNQIRRTIKSVKATIVEVYGRRSSKSELVRLITNAIVTNDKTIDHLENLFETGSLKNEKLFKDLHFRLDTLGKKLNLFIQSVDKWYNAPKKPPETS